MLTHHLGTEALDLAEDAAHMLQRFTAAVQVLLYRKHSWIFY